MTTASADPEPTPAKSTLIAWRDRLAFWCERRSKLLQALGCGLAMGWVAYSAGARIISPQAPAPGTLPLHPWAIPIGLGVLVLALLNRRAAAVVMGTVCTLQLSQVAPALAWAAAGLSIVFFFFCHPRREGRACTLLLAPYLAQIGLGVIPPLGFGIVLARRGGMLWAGLSFLWCVLHGIPFGAQRLGIPGIPETADLFRAWGLSRAKGVQVPGFSEAWAQGLLERTDFPSLLEPVRAMLTEQALPLLLQLLIWVLVAAAVARLFLRRDLADRLALEYLEKAGRATRVPPYRRLYGAVTAGTLAFVIPYIVLGAAFDSVKYGPVAGAILSLAGGLLFFLPLHIVLEGDQEAGRPARHRHRTHNEHRSLLKDPPPAAAGARPRPAQPAPGRPPGAKPIPHWGEAGGPPTLPKHLQKRPASAATGASAARQPAAATPTAGSGQSTVEAIMFIDMVGSTALGSKYGDDYVLGMKERLGRIVAQEAAKEGVLFRKGTGDGHMLTFPECVNAVQAALGIFRETGKENASVPAGRGIKLRIGIHYGQINIDSNGDRIGTTANMAARIEAAKLDQVQAAEVDVEDIDLPLEDRILVSEVVADEVRDLPACRLRAIGYFSFKGIAGLRQIFLLETT